jgi:hypothetical protein
MINLLLWLIQLGAGWPVALLDWPQVQHFLHFLEYLALAIQGMALGAPPWGIIT